MLTIFASSQLYCLVVFISDVIANTVQPTIVNFTGDYYIASKDNDLSYRNISCSSIDCYIICHQKNGCKNTIINASKSISLTIECTADEFSCSRLQLIHSATYSTRIKCLDEYGCSHVNLQTYPSRIVAIECVTQYTCFFATIDATSAVSFQLSCNGRKSCFKSNIFTNNAQSVSLVASSHYSMYRTNINASNASSLYVEAIDNAAMYRVRMHVPCNGFHLRCGDYGCLTASYIYVAEPLTNGSVVYNGVCYGDDPLDIISNVSIYCNGYVMEHCGVNSANSTCGCGMLWNGLQDSYVLHCPPDENEKAVFQLTIPAVLGIMFGFLCLIVIALWWIVCRGGSQKESVNAALLADTNPNDEASPYIAPKMDVKKPTEDETHTTEMASTTDNHPDIN
eukprot:149855_1